MNPILPQPIDNNYRGHKLAIWLFVVVVFVKSLQGLVALANPYSVARSGDGIPIETYSTAAAQAVVALFAISGFSRLLISLGCVLVLVRYRSAIPLMFAVLAMDYLGRQLILYFYPIVRIGTPTGVIVNLILFTLTLIGLVLSLWSQRDHEELA